MLVGIDPEKLSHLKTPPPKKKKKNNNNNKSNKENPEIYTKLILKQKEKVINQLIRWH